MVQVIQANERPGFGQGFARGLGKELPGFLNKFLDEDLLKRREDRQLAQKLGIQQKEKETGMERAREFNSLLGQMPEEQVDPTLRMIGQYGEKTGDWSGAMDIYKNIGAAKAQQARANKPPGGLSGQPIPPEVGSAIEKIVKDNPNASADELAITFDQAGVPRAYANSYVENRRRDFDRKTNLEESRYKLNQPFIEETQQKYQGFETEMKPRLLQMQSMDPEKLISAPEAVFLDSLGIPLGALKNPESELYNKLSQDLLKGLPDTYGNRILKVEVDNFLKTIPQLTNSPDGRRMIASNMLKLGEMKEVYYKEMRKLQKEYSSKGQPLPTDFQQEVFDNVKPQIDRINNEFVKLTEITKVPPGTHPFFDPQGNIKFVPKENLEWAMKNGGRRIW